MITVPPTPTMMTVTIECPPIPKGRPRMNPRTGRAYTPPRTKMAEDDARWWLRVGMNRIGAAVPFAGPLAVDLTFIPADNRRVDLDNLVKLIWDAANGVVWVDDCQVIDLHARKRLPDKTHPHTLFTVRAAEVAGPLL